MNITLDESGHVKGVSLLFERDGGEVDYEDLDISVADQNIFDDIAAVSEPLQRSVAFEPPCPQRENFESRHGKASVNRFLCTVPHLFTLCEEDIAGLNVMVREYSEMDIVMEEGTMLHHVFVLASGTVEVINTRVGLRRVFGHRRVGSMTAPSIFGIDDIILNKPTEFSYHASSSVTLLLIPKHQFCELLSRSSVFANSISSYVAQTLRDFSVFEDFCRSLFGLSLTSVTKRENSGENGYRLSMPNIVEIYESSDTTLHKLMKSTRIDTDALQYAVRRLPENISDTVVIVLSRVLPPFLAQNVMTEDMRPFYPVKCRHCTWRVDVGNEIFVIARDGFTDIIDFVTNLCMLVVESKKLRLRMKSLVAPSAIEILQKALQTEFHTEDLIESVLSQLSFKKQESIGLVEVWGSSVLKTLRSILLSREEFVVHVDVNMSNKFASSPFLNLSLSIMRQIKSELRIPDEDTLPKDVRIDIMFSSNMVVKTLLCSASDVIKPLVEDEDSPMCNSGAASLAEDCNFYVVSQILEQDKEARDAYRQRLESCGFILMEYFVSSGIVVDLINVAKLRSSDMDPRLHAAIKQRNNKRGRFIINIDRTFGAQIEAVLHSLILTFGDNIWSVNLIGTAAGLVGKRGDVVLPKKLLFSKQSFGEDSTDETRICNKGCLSEEDLLPFMGDGSFVIHRGSCVTVAGTILYSDSVLRFYKALHGCTAADMRSSHVARQLEESHRIGVLRPGVEKRFLFCLDSIPLSDDKETVETKQQDVLFSLYATARCVLNLIMSSE